MPISQVGQARSFLLRHSSNGVAKRRSCYGNANGGNGHAGAPGNATSDDGAGDTGAANPDARRADDLSGAADSDAGPGGVPVRVQAA